MARRGDNRVLTVGVVGLSGTEKEKGVTGVGKSCLCNRFIDSRADNYHIDHISVLSQSDFGGQVVNNDHFLYWGDVIKTSDEGVDHTFRVIEQTEFVDDSSFQPFKCGKTEPYYKRCAQIRLQSAEKLMYICKTQLGLEHEFDRVLLPDGKILVDGFLCMFDVSLVQQRPLERQLDYTVHILTNLLKTKKPIVLVTSKNDEGQENYAREAEKMLTSRKEFRNCTIPIVEVSAHENVNVELAFMTLAHQIEKTGKARVKAPNYADSARIQKELRDVAREAYLNLIRSHVTDHKALWTSVLCKIKQNDNYVHFQDLCGTDNARKLFHKHMIQLKEQYLQRRKENYLERLRIVLREVLPDLHTIADRSWPATLQWLQRQDFFDDFYVVVPHGGCWRSTEFIECEDHRIPFDLLESPEAEKMFRNHLNALRAEQKRKDLMVQFKRLLERNQNLTGKSLAETAIFFLGHQCFSGLSEEDKNLVYEQHQEQLREIARGHFIELLQENALIFTKYEQNQVTEDDLIDITSKLQIEPRWRAMNQLEQDRRVILLNHLGFIQCPSREQCPYGEHCMESLISSILSTKAHRPQSWSRNSQFLLDAVDNRLNLVLLGTHGLADQLAHEIQLQCIEDEYTLGNEIFSLDYRPIDGDVSLPRNSFKTTDFKPHGCFCIYNSVDTLMYLVENLRKTLMTDLQRGERLPFKGLPVVVVLAHNPHINDKELQTLRDEGQQLSDRLQCPFVDVPSSLMLDPARRFHQDQINLAMYNLVKCIQHRSSFVQPWHIAESIEPDIRILMCFMCGDNFQVDLPIAPLLNHQCCYVTTDKFPTITLETYLGDSKRKVEVTVTSYHGGTQVREDLYHGFILVYSAKRKASLANLSAFADSVPPVPTQIIAVSEAGGASAFFSSDAQQAHIVEGNALADKLGTRFMITCANFRQQTASYTPFFKESWDRKDDTEHMFQFSMEEAPLVDMRGYDDAIRSRPPAALPKGAKKTDPFGVGKGSTSNSQSTEDSEPIYDQPHLDPCHSDSDGDELRASSTSPPPGCRDNHYSHDNVTDEQFPSLSEEAYNELNQPDTEHLLKPSQLKSKRAMYSEDTVDGQGDKRSPPPTLPKPPADKPRIGPLDLNKFRGVCQVINHNLTAPQLSGKVRAPLATPEQIEISDYAQVKDALPVAENAYASVADALPSGRIHKIRSTFSRGKKKQKGGAMNGTDSESDECSSIEREKLENIYSRVHRQPTPHKKKNKSRRGDIPIPTPPLPPYTDDRQVLVREDQLQRFHHSASDGSEGTGDELHYRNRVKKKNRLRRNQNHPYSDSNLTDSPLSKTSVDDENLFDPLNTSGEFSPRNKDKQKEQKERQKEEKRKKKKVPTATLR